MEQTDALRRGQRLFKIGAWWHAIGCGPLYILVLLAAVGVADRDANPVGFGIIAFISFLPSLALMVLGGGLIWMGRRGGGER